VKEIVVAGFVLSGGAFLLMASIGIVRFPDLYTRMQASAKAGTLGVACLVAAAAIHFEELGITTRAALIVIFFVMTAPVAAHLLSRAAYHSGVPLWHKTRMDELRDRSPKKRD
jgi:multicomponent Na+:H+ antiporter subunit G